MLLCICVKYVIVNHEHISHLVLSVSIGKFEHVNAERVVSHLLKKSLIENFSFCAVCEIFRSSRVAVFREITVLKNTVKDPGKHLCWSHF